MTKTANPAANTETSVRDTPNIIPYTDVIML